MKRTLAVLMTTAFLLVQLLDISVLEAAPLADTSDTQTTVEGALGTQVISGCCEGAASCHVFHHMISGSRQTDHVRKVLNSAPQVPRQRLSIKTVCQGPPVPPPNV